MSNDTVDTVNAVFRCESYRLFLLALPVDGVFQTEPPGKRLRQLWIQNVSIRQDSLYKLH